MMNRTERQIDAELAHFRALQDGDPTLAAKPLVECSPKFVAALAIEAVRRIQLAAALDLEALASAANSAAVSAQIEAAAKGAAQTRGSRKRLA